jgi:uncharacterized membrane protein YccC
MKTDQIDSVIEVTGWAATFGGVAAATASMLDNVTGLAFVAWTIGGVALGAAIGFAFGSVASHLDRRDEIKADATARQMAQMFERQDDTKRRAA